MVIIIPAVTLLGPRHCRYFLVMNVYTLRSKFWLLVKRNTPGAFTSRCQLYSTALNWENENVQLAPTTDIPINQHAIPELGNFESPTEQDRHTLLSDPILSQFVNTIMRDGKKALAQRIVANALYEIRKQTKSDPFIVFKDAIEMASPILKVIPQKKGSKVLQVPMTMTERQRRRKAIVWIMEASKKRREKKAGVRLGLEILAVVNGDSSALSKKQQLHKSAEANRANANLKY